MMQQKQIPPCSTSQYCCHDLWKVRGKETYPEETSEITPVPSTGVQHVRRQNTTRDADDDVQHATQDDSLDLQPTGRHLRHEREAHGSDGELVAQCPTEHDGPGGNGSLVLVFGRHEAEEAKNEQHDAQSTETVKIH